MKIEDVFSALMLSACLLTETQAIGECGCHITFINSVDHPDRFVPVVSLVDIDEFRKLTNHLGVDSEMEETGVGKRLVANWNGVILRCWMEDDL